MKIANVNTIVTTGTSTNSAKRSSSGMLTQKVISAARMARPNARINDVIVCLRVNSFFFTSFLVIQCVILQKKKGEELASALIAKVVE